MSCGSISHSALAIRKVNQTSRPRKNSPCNSPDSGRSLSSSSAWKSGGCISLARAMLASTFPTLLERFVQLTAKFMSHIVLTCCLAVHQCRRPNVLQFGRRAHERRHHRRPQLANECGSSVVCYSLESRSWSQRKLHFRSRTASRRMRSDTVHRGAITVPAADQSVQQTHLAERYVGCRAMRYAPIDTSSGRTHEPML
jgi:hypothetical protein